MRPLTLLLLSCACFAQTPSAAPLTPPKPEAPKRAPTQREKAMELVTAVRDGVGAADPILQPFLLWRTADIWIPINRAKARKYLDEAFERASAMPPGLVMEPKGTLQTWIAGSMLALDLDRAVEMLKQVY